MTTKTTQGAAPGDLARLWELGAGGELPEERRYADHIAAELLRERLDSPLPMDPAQSDSLLVMVGGASVGLLPLAGRSLREVLLDPHTGMAAIQPIKDYAKQLARRHRTGPEHEAAIGIYYTALAGALVYRGEKITAHGYDYLRDSFEQLLSKPWLPPEVAELFRRARQVCSDRAE